MDERAGHRHQRGGKLVTVWHHRYDGEVLAVQLGFAALDIAVATPQAGAFPTGRDE